MRPLGESLEIDVREAARPKTEGEVPIIVVMLLVGRGLLRQRRQQLPDVSRVRTFRKEIEIDRGQATVALGGGHLPEPRLRRRFGRRVALEIELPRSRGF